MFERNDDVLFVCYDNEGYMNTGVQRSGATPPAARTANTKALGAEPGNAFGQGKFLPLIALAHEIPYVATATVAELRDLEYKVERAMSFRDFPDQRQVVSLLQRSLERQRLAHAYLFTGADTTELEAVARTLGKTLNCESPVRGENAHRFEQIVEGSAADPEQGVAGRSELNLFGPVLEDQQQAAIR